MTKTSKPFALTGPMSSSSEPDRPPCFGLRPKQPRHRGPQSSTKRPDRATTSRALVIHARGAEILDRLGALGDLPQRALKALAFNFYLGQQPLARMAVPAAAGNPLPLVIGQTEVEAQLRARLAELQSEVIWGCELLGVERETNEIKVTLRTADGDHEMRAGWLVGCDGRPTARPASWPASASKERRLRTIFAR